jgi:D-xylose 1-dehydrogenase (NADP+, D-xylono-1,5-lactone-forming)
MKLKSNSQLKWGLAATGRMAHLFAMELKKFDCNLVAVASRELENAMAFSSQLSIPYCYDSVSEMLSHIDVLYIPTPNHLHMPISKMAMEAGVHVLCEKPASLNHQELSDFSIYRSQLRDVPFWCEGFLYRTHPFYHQLFRLINEGEFGDVISLDGQFGIKTPYHKNEFRYESNFGGGCLLDLGVYGISMIAWVLGWEMQSQFVSLKKNYNVDTDTTLEFANEQGQKARFRASFEENLSPKMEIHTSQGLISMTNPWTPDSSNCLIEWKKKTGGRQLLHQGDTSIAWGREALHVEQLIEGRLKESPFFTLTDSLAQAKLIDAIKGEMKKEA